MEAMAEGLIDIRQAAELTGRHPETIRRWVWSGRLQAERRGRQLLVAEADVRALAGGSDDAISLADWARMARAVRTHATGPTRRTAADLVLADRARRS
jgi:excisionase family DNA binding protein